MVKEKPALYASYDLDGVIFYRLPVQFEAVAHSAKNFGVLVPDWDGKVDVSRDLTTRDLNTIERAALLYVQIERPSVNIPILIRSLPRKLESHAEKLGLEDTRTVFNTGRLYHPEWEQVTWVNLRDAGVDTFFDKERSFFRPDGVTTRISKREGVRQLLEDGSYLIHFDDNPLDAYAVASLDRDRVFAFIIQDLTNGFLFSRDEERDYPNIRRVASLWHAVSDMNINVAVSYFTACSLPVAKV